jgi:hypothetical protein
MRPPEQPAQARVSVSRMKRKTISSDELVTSNKKLNTAHGGTQLNGDQELNFPDMPDEATTLTAEIKQLECEVQINWNPDTGFELTMTLNSWRCMRHPGRGSKSWNNRSQTLSSFFKSALRPSLAPCKIRSPQPWNMQSGTTSGR